MKTERIIKSLVSILIFVLCSSPINSMATPYTFEFEGVITEQTGYTYNNWLNVGHEIYGFFTFDSSFLQQWSGIGWHWVGNDIDDGGLWDEGQFVAGAGSSFMSVEQGSIVGFTYQGLDFGFWGDLLSSTASFTFYSTGRGSTNGKADINPIPEPTTILLLSAGLASLIGFKKRFQN